MAFEKITEQDSNHNDLENKSVTALIHGIHSEDKTVALAVETICSVNEADISAAKTGIGSTEKITSDGR